MDYVKGALSGVAAILLAEFVPASWSILRGNTQGKATGLGAVTAGLAESIRSPLFWGLAVLFFALFFAAGRLGSKLFRVFLFWIPTLGISTLGVALLALFAYVLTHSRRG